MLPGETKISGGITLELNNRGEVLEAPYEGYNQNLDFLSEPRYGYVHGRLVNAWVRDVLRMVLRDAHDEAASYNHSGPRGSFASTRSSSLRY